MPPPRASLLPAQLAHLTAQLSAQRADVPAAVREHVRAQHDAHFAELEASAQAVRAAEGAPLPAAAECDAACLAELVQLAERDARLGAELRDAAVSLGERAAKERDLVAQLDSVIAIEARQCATQDMLCAPNAKSYTAGCAPPPPQRAARRVCAR